MNVSPLYSAPSTDFSNIYQVLKIFQNISAPVPQSRKTFIALDLQLYAKALQLQGRNEIAINFVLQPGQLSIIFSFQQAIENNGLDKFFIDFNI